MGKLIRRALVTGTVLAAGCASTPGNQLPAGSYSGELNHRTVQGATYDVLGDMRYELTVTGEEWAPRRMTRDGKFEEREGSKSRTVVFRYTGKGAKTAFERDKREAAAREGTNLYIPSFEEVADWMQDLKERRAKAEERRITGGGRYGGLVRRKPVERPEEEILYRVEADGTLVLDGKFFGRVIREGLWDRGEPLDGPNPLEVFGDDYRSELPREQHPTWMSDRRYGGDLEELPPEAPKGSTPAPPVPTKNSTE